MRFLAVIALLSLGALFQAPISRAWAYAGNLVAGSGVSRHLTISEFKR